MTLNEVVLSKLKLSTITPDIELAIKEVDVKVRNYCNFSKDEEIPESLLFVQANMIVELIKSESEEIETAIKSVSMGDTSYTFDVGSKVKAVELILDYEADLKAHRRLRK